MYGLTLVAALVRISSGCNRTTIPLHEGWVACRAASCEKEKWVSPRLPTTALMTLLARGNEEVFASAPALRPGETSVDPYYALNLAAIRDINETGREFYTLRWERPLEIEAGCSGLLELAGINYRARVYVDDVEIFAQEPFGGLWARRTYGIAGGAGTLAIVVEPPEHPGTSNCTGVDGACGQGGDHSLAQDVTSQFLLGWDWMRAIPDRSTGFFGHVELTTLDTNGVVIRDAAVLTRSLACATTGCGSVTDATVRVVARIGGGDAALRYVAVARLPGGIVARARSFFLGSGVVRDIEVDVVLPNATLWWPRGVLLPEKTTPQLHEAVVEVVLADDDALCALRRVRFGVRVFETSIEPRTRGRKFGVNGVDMFIVGGNWIVPDAMWRFSADKYRYRAEVELHAATGLNALRVWGGGVAERDEFYEACDEIGMVVYQEFWMTGDNNGRWAGSYDWPLDGDAYGEAISATVARLRRFPSLMAYGGGNELYPANLSPPRFAVTAIQRALSDLDPWKPCIPSSMDGGLLGGNESEHDDAYAIAPKDGPYGMLLPEEFSERNPGLDRGLIISLSPEIGSTSAPNDRDALLTFMSSRDAETGFPPPPSSSSSSSSSSSENGVADVGSAWTFHQFEEFTADVGNATYDFAYAYAPSRRAAFDVDDWLAFAKLAQYQQYQLLFESFLSRVYEWYTGLFMWKSQSPWPALRGFLYDWYGLRPNGAWYGARSAALPLRKAQLDIKTLDVRVVNRASTPWHVAGDVRYEWLDVSGTVVAADDLAVAGMTIPPLSARRVGTAAPQPPACGSVCFVRLTTTGIAAVTVYWRSLQASLPDYSVIGDMRDRSVAIASLRVARCTREPDASVVVLAEIRVPLTSPELLFYPELKLRRRNSSVSLVPLAAVPGGDAAVVVLPGSTSVRTLTVLRAHARATARGGDRWWLQLDAVNLRRSVVVPIIILEETSCLVV